MVAANPCHPHLPSQPSLLPSPTLPLPPTPSLALARQLSCSNADLASAEVRRVPEALGFDLPGAGCDEGDDRCIREMPDIPHSGWNDSGRRWNDSGRGSLGARARARSRTSEPCFVMHDHRVLFVALFALSVGGGLELLRVRVCARA